MQHIRHWFETLQLPLPYWQAFGMTYFICRV
jgi:hypothetical protein